MGFYFRKSVSFGGVRFNFSKSGVGASVGVKGFRVGTGPRSNYIHMGMKGVYYRAALGTKKYKSSTNTPINPTFQDSGTSNNDNLLFQEITSGDISLIVDSSSQDIVNEINEKRKKIPFWLFALLCIFIPTVGIPIAIILAILINVTIDSKRKTTILFYDIEEQTEQNIQQFYDSFEELMNCKMTWHVSAKANVHNSNIKYNAGASQVVQKSKISIKYSVPSCIKTNVKVPTIPVGKKTLYFFPDRILIFDGKTVGGLVYNNLIAVQSSQRFIEAGSVPSDGTVVDHTWQYVNKSGGPDKRFSNNRQLPVLMYSDVTFKSNTGLNELIQLSKQNVGLGLTQQLEKYKNNQLLNNAETNSYN